MNLHSVFFLGIGGIGMSALARFLKQKNIPVAGYDKTPTQLTQQLQNENIPVFFEDNPNLITDFDCVVYTPAIPKELKLFQNAQKTHKKVIKRSELLGEISLNFKTLAVAGTHGKTTTSSMLAHLLKSSQIDCSAFIGGITKNYNSNYISGNQDILVVEADEYDRSFWTLFPEMAIITSVDPDHLDIYLTPQGFEEGFIKFCSQVKKKIFLHDHLRDFSKKINPNYDFYGINGQSKFTLRLKGSSGLTNYFDYLSPEWKIQDLELHFPGEHNLKNICAAITVALHQGATEKGIRQGVKTFQGIKRRFDIMFYSQDLVYIDDYAHHPDEISALLHAVKMLLPQHQVIAIFQPHLYSRTRDFYQEFAKSLSIADEIILLPIYPARELPIEGVQTEIIFSEINKKSKYLLSKDEVFDYLPSFIRKPSVILTIGAGDIDTIVEKLQNLIKTWA